MTARIDRSLANCPDGTPPATCPLRITSEVPFEGALIRVTGTNAGGYDIVIGGKPYRHVQNVGPTDTEERTDADRDERRRRTQEQCEARQKLERTAIRDQSADRPRPGCGRDSRGGRYRRSRASSEEFQTAGHRGAKRAPESASGVRADAARAARAVPRGTVLRESGAGHARLQPDALPHQRARPVAAPARRRAPRPDAASCPWSRRRSSEVRLLQHLQPALGCGRHVHGHDDAFDDDGGGQRIGAACGERDPLPDRGGARRQLQRAGQDVRGLGRHLGPGRTRTG